MSEPIDYDDLCKRLPGLELACSQYLHSDYGELVRNVGQALAALREQVAAQSNAADMIAEERDVWDVMRDLDRLEADNAALREQVEALSLQVKMRPAPEVREDTALIRYCEQLKADNAALREVIGVADKMYWDHAGYHHDYMMAKAALLAGKEKVNG